MARPLAEIAVLKGKDVVAFINRMQSEKNKRVSKADRERIKENFNKLSAMAQF